MTTSRIVAAALGLAGLLGSTVARAGEQPEPPDPAGWSAARPDVVRAVRAGAPLVVHVVVPLCNSALIDCGATWAGNPGDLRRNVYWGAIFGARRFLERKGSGWERVELTTAGAARPAGASDEPTPLPEHVLERVVFRRDLDGAPWGLASEERVEVIAVLEAFHGGFHDAALTRFFELSQGGAVDRVGAGSAARDLAVHVVGWAGHNRLMDGVKPPSAPAASRAGTAFVLACDSRGYFSDALAERGARFVVGTRTLMAPEGYALAAVLLGLGENVEERALTERAIDAYARWQKIPRSDAAWTFRVRR